jgi:aldehyde dehydrogenase (NAD+)
VHPQHGGERTDVIDASNAALLGSVARASSADVDLAVGLARDAFTEWSRTFPEHRATTPGSLRDALAERAQEAARLISLEVGSPTLVSQRVQLGWPLQTLQGLADAARHHPWEESVGLTLVLPEPAGMVGAIPSWNYSLHQLVGGVRAALAAGCTVVAKSAEVAPTSTSLLAEACEAAGPPARALNLVTGPTGSTTVGARVAALAAANITRAALELASKSASVLLDDADLPPAVKVSVNSAFLNSGQAASAWTRLVVPRERQAEVLGMAEAAATKLTLGHALAAGTRPGPLASAAQQRTVRDYSDPRTSGGATLVTGGSGAPTDLTEGFYISPTVFGDVKRSARIAQEEIFGPALCLPPHDGDEYAIDSAYGLGGAVWPAGEEWGMAPVHSMRTGQIDLNGARLYPFSPFGGYKHSGMGRKVGNIGIDESVDSMGVQL